MQNDFITLFLINLHFVKKTQTVEKSGRGLHLGESGECDEEREEQVGVDEDDLPVGEEPNVVVQSIAAVYQRVYEPGKHVQGGHQPVDDEKRLAVRPLCKCLFFN